MEKALILWGTLLAKNVMGTVMILLGMLSDMVLAKRIFATISMEQKLVLCLLKQMKTLDVADKSDWGLVCPVSENDCDVVDAINVLDVDSADVVLRDVFREVVFEFDCRITEGTSDGLLDRPGDGNEA